MNKAIRAVAGGVAGTAVLTLGLVVTDVETGYRIGIFEAIASFVGTPERLALGFALFVLAGVFAWPLVFVAVEDYLPGGPDPAVRGLLFAAVLWVAFALTGSPGVDFPLVVPYLALTLLAHLAYGYIMGAVYAQLDDVDVGREAGASV
ncbi:hypothetical protein NGM10_16150 (plasmid) [Halorussus salilacus]|uniref:DUF6789 family protein n=1 Tax=Halorussus salilacus TaxID=2953750 RepID=UPI0020A08C4B|nr:DUF6789 family protein [Halorussus salilacus]USZ69934.1 hypothetical protein NGM10_16150 [Halorussus salilacus]